MYFWSLMFLFIIPSISDTFSRFQRQAAENQSQITEMATRHIKLGRVLNALYLQNQLSTQKIDFYDVITGIWNLKNRTVIEELVYLNIDGMPWLLEKLNKAIKEVPDDVTPIFDAQRINDTYTSLKTVITEKVRQDLKNGKRVDAIPSFIREGNNFLIVKPLDKNLMDEILNMMETIEKDDKENSRLNQIQLADLMFACSLALSGLPNLIESVMKDSDSTLDGLVNGYQAAVLFDTKSAELKSLSAYFSEAQGKLNGLESLKSILTAEKSFKTLESFLNDFRQPATNIPIGSAFLADYNLEIVFNDLQDEWLKTVLNRGRSMKRLADSLESFKKLMAIFTPISNTSVELFNSDHLYNVMLISDAITQIKMFQDSNVNTTNLIDCFKPPVKQQPQTSVNELISLAADWKTAKNGVGRLPTALNVTAEQLNRLRAYEKKVRYMKDDEFQNWVTDANSVEFKKFIEDLNANMKSIKLDLSVTNAVNNLDRIYDKVIPIEQYIVGVKGGDMECNLVFRSLNFEIWKKLNQVPEVISLVKTQMPIEKLKPLLDTILKVNTGLLDFETLTQSYILSESRLRLSNPENLLHVAFATHTFQQMEEINRHSQHIETFNTRRARITNEIKSWPDSKTKTEVEKVWDQYDVTNQTLYEILAKIEEAFAKIQTSAPEKSFEEIGKVYKTLASVPMSQKVRIREFRETMPVFMQKDVKFYVHSAKLIESLEFLEKSAEMDWGMAYSGFQKVPKALEELKMDFSKFFRSDVEIDNLRENEKIEIVIWLEENLTYICVIGGLILSFIILILVGWGAYYLYFYFDFELKYKKLPEDAIYLPSKIVYERDYTHMQLQDSRLPLNQIDPKTGNTQLFDAIIDQNWVIVGELGSAGAIMDAVCGPHYRTGLSQLVVTSRVACAEKFLKYGADPEIYDVYGIDMKQKIIDMGWTHLLKYFEKGGDFKRIRPNERRPWNILVFDPKPFPRKLLKKLPLRFKKNVTWGYKPSMKLDDFTQIVVPEKWVKDEDTLILDESDLMTFRLYGCKACLVTMDWLVRMANEKDKEEQQRVMIDDFSYWLYHTLYLDSKHENTVLKLKNGIHRMTPKILEGVRIRTWGTGDRDVWKGQDGWRELIKIFGGNILDKIEPDTLNTVPPYHTLTKEYREKGWKQNACWILKYEDSVFGEKDRAWMAEYGKYCLSHFRFLPECIARYSILPHGNPFVKTEGLLKPPSGSIQDDIKESTAAWKWSSQYKKVKKPIFEYHPPDEEVG